MKFSNFLIFAKSFNEKNYGTSSPSKEQIFEYFGKQFERKIRMKYEGKDIVMPTAKSISDTLIEREKIVTTGMGYGIALPNGKVKDFPGIAFGIYRVPDLDWGSMDGNPVKIIVPSISNQDGIGAHLNLMVHLGRLLKNEKNRKAICEATDFSRTEIDMKTLIEILDNYED